MRKEIVRLRKKVFRLLRDDLTGLPKFRAFKEYLRDYLHFPHSNRPTADYSRESFASLWVLDLHNFKNINDTYGHRAGDIALKQVAYFMKGHFRSRRRRYRKNGADRRTFANQDFFARWGGDEFCVFISGLIPEKGVQSAEKEIGRITQRFQELHEGADPAARYECKDLPSELRLPFKVKVDIGVVYWKEKAVPYRNLAKITNAVFENADSLMRAAKEERKKQASGIGVHYGHGKIEGDSFTLLWKSGDTS